MANRQNPRRRRRPGSIGAVLSLTVITIAALASSQPARDQGGATHAAIRDQSVALATRNATSPDRPSGGPLAPILDSRRVLAAPRRPAIVVPLPSPQVVLRPTSGATAVFLGDSYTTGWNGAGIGNHGWPELVGRARDWRTINLAVAGTGFLNPGWTNQPIGAMVAGAIRQKPDIVFLAAGHNDSRWSVEATASEADRLIDRLHAALPDALLVIVAPIWPSGSPPARCLQLRDHLRRTAASVGAIFIDPLAEGWFAGSSHRFVGSDGIHPTNAGHRNMADRVLADLAAAD